MNVQVEDISAVKKRVQVSIPKDRVETVHNQVAREMGRRVKVPGFRPGKVPRPVLERYYGPDIEKEVASRLIGETMDDVFRSHGIEAVATPALEKSERISDDGFGFRYAVSVEVKPPLEPRDYMGLSVERVEFEVSSEHIEAELAKIQDQLALLRTIEEERPVQKGDIVVIDIQGKVDGQPIPGANSENFLVEVGSGKILPGLEEGLIGLRPHSTGDIPVTLPSDFKQAQLAGKPAVFTIAVKELKQKILPDLTDEFAREVGGFTTLQELRDKIRQDLQQLADRAAEEGVRDSILEQLRQIHPLDLPPSMVEEEGRLIFRNLQARLSTPEGKAERAGISDEQIMARCLDVARKQVHARLVLEAIGRKEGLSVTEEEMNEELQRQAHRSGTTVERLKKNLEERGTMENVRLGLLEEKAFDFLKKSAAITPVKKPLKT